MNEKSSDSPLDQAIQEAENGNALLALMHLEKIPREKRNPLHTSYLGYCIAKEHEQFGKALNLCKKSIQQAPQNPVCYLNFGRVCLIAGHKHYAIKAFRQSLKIGCTPQVIDELQILGLRKAPVFPSLPRESFLNRYLGLFFSRLGLR